MTLTCPAGLLNLASSVDIERFRSASPQAVHYNAHCRASEVGVLVQSKDDQVTPTIQQKVLSLPQESLY